MSCRFDSFLLKREFFKQLFAGPQARKDDRDFQIWLRARESNQVCRQLGNSHRRTHIEHKDFAPLSHRGGLKDKLCCFRNGHEVTLSVRMRYRDRPSPCDLLGEDWQYTPIAAQDVAKPHGTKP